MFQYAEICQQYSGELIWKLIPTQWRKWWFDELQFQLPTPFEGISLSEPKSRCIGRTEDLYKFDADIKS